MLKQIDISTKEDKENHIVRYKFENYDVEYTCSNDDWEKYLLMYKLVQKGVDEQDLDDLYSMGYEKGHDDGYWRAKD